MEREHRHLDGEAQEEGQEDPPLQVRRQRQLVVLEDVERVHACLGGVRQVERDDAQQHQDGTEQRVQEEPGRPTARSPTGACLAVVDESGVREITRAKALRRKEEDMTENEIAAKLPE